MWTWNMMPLTYIIFLLEVCVGPNQFHPHIRLVISMLGRNCLYTFFWGNSLKYYVNYKDIDSLQIASHCLTPVSLRDGYWKVINKKSFLYPYQS